MKVWGQGGSQLARHRGKDALPCNGCRPSPQEAHSQSALISDLYPCLPTPRKGITYSRPAGSTRQQRGFFWLFAHPGVGWGGVGYDRMSRTSSSRLAVRASLANCSPGQAKWTLR